MRSDRVLIVAVLGVATAVVPPMLGVPWVWSYALAVAGLGVAALVLAWSATASAAGNQRGRRRAVEMIRAVEGGSAAAGGAPATLDAALEELDRCVSRQSRELLKHARNLASILDALDEPVIATDRDDKVMLCNAPAERAFGGAGSLAGRGIREFITSDAVLALHAAARRGRLARGQARLITPEGPRVYAISAAPLPSAWGEGVFGVVLALSDVTELAQAGAMRTEFVANASHEMRTPVAAIRAAVETLEDAGADDPALRARLLGMIASHSRRLEDMTRDLMDLSRLESTEVPLRVGAIDWDEIEVTLRETFEAALSTRRLTLEFDVEADLRDGGVGFRTDARLVLLILRNLVDNATKHAREQTPIRVSARRRGTGARLEVRDEGTGIPLEHQERVFERFYQVDTARTGTGSASGGGGSGATRPRRGTGLGLAIVKHATKALGGSVGLESVWGRGTTVWVEIPGAGAEPPPAR